MTMIYHSLSKKVLAPSSHEPQSLVPTELLEARLDTLEQDTMGDSWRNVLKPEFKKPYFQKVLGFYLYNPSYR
jgi:hypothetical protein